MNYVGMPLAMWALFATSFRTHLQTVVGLDEATAKAVTHKAKKAYREILSPLPDFEKGDQFQMNLVNCAMLCAFVLSTPQRPDVQTLTDFYARAMMTRPMRWFCRQSGKGRFSEQSMAKLRKTAQLRAADRNPYSWNMEFYPCPDGSGYEARLHAMRHLHADARTGPI